MAHRPRTEDPVLTRYHERVSLVGTVPIGENPGPYTQLTVIKGKPMRPDYRSYPIWVGQGPEAYLAGA